MSGLLGFWPPLGFFLLLSLALNHNYLRGGFYLDDLFFVNAMQMDPAPFSRWRGIWCGDIERVPGLGNLWWFEPGTEVRFFRPLPSLGFEAAYRLFGQNAFPLHLLSILLHGVVAFTTFRFFARLTESGAIRHRRTSRTLAPLFPAFLAGVLFITCEDHSMGVGWLATMTDLLCVAFINLALLAHLRWRAEGGWRWLCASLVCFALSLGSKETAVAAPVAILLLEWLVPQRNGPWSAAALGCPDSVGIEATVLHPSPLTTHHSRPIPRWLPSAVLLLVFLVAYKLLELGGTRSLLYIDPLCQPLDYVRHAATALPIMFSGALTVIPPALSIFDPGLLLPQALFGGILFGLWLWGGTFSSDCSCRARSCRPTIPTSSFGHWKRRSGIC